jgi:putative flavoprotein involved in K+ transport
VLATGPFHKPFVPPAAERLAPGVVQLHSYDYGRPSDLPEGPVLVVGGGNSAAQLAVELARTREVTVAAPREPWFLPEDVLGVSMYWWTLLTGVLNADADARVSRYVRRRGDSIVGKELQALVRSRRVALHTSRVVDADGAVVVLQDGTRLPVRNVLWCTGFRPDTGWIDVPGAVDERGEPVHEAGASPVPGLHWMGLPWQTRLNSSIIDGVDRDAKALADRIGPRRRAA